MIAIDPKLAAKTCFEKNTTLESLVGSIYVPFNVYQLKSVINNIFKIAVIVAFFIAKSVPNQVENIVKFIILFRLSQINIELSI